MPDRIVVANTTPLIALALVNQLDLRGIWLSDAIVAEALKLAREI